MDIDEVNPDDIIHDNANHETMDSESGVMYTPTCDDVSIKPFEGKRFATLKEAIQSYTHYARTVGFNVRRSSEKTIDGVVVWKYLLCSREGDKHFAVASKGDSSTLEKKINRRKSTRCGCPARIVFKYESDFGYIVSKFYEQHNHELVEDEHKVFLKVNRKLDLMHQQFIIDCARASIGPTHAKRLLDELLGGNYFVGCTVLEVRNFTRDMKAYVDGSDAQMLLNELKRKKKLWDSFTFDFEVDEEDKLKRLFWCDPISKRNFQLFGDVVAFDTTYSTNKYCMIFAPFTGKDNHGRPVTFAAGLLSHEDADSFIWLFNKFVACMGSTPHLIITDQDLGMKAAINEVLKHTRHRWCMWHIMLKLADKVSKELHADEDFKKELSSCVWSEMIEPKEFDAAWDSIMKTYGLEDDPWFKSMFKQRKMWVPAYFRDFPMSGLVRTTSIAECENSFYKRYTKSRSNLLEFWMNFNHALEAQRYHSSKLNYDDKTSIPELLTKVSIEKDAAKKYTSKIFERVQVEISSACFNCRILEMYITDHSEHFKIQDELNYIVNVSYVREDDAYSCSCKLFGRHGILCRHIFLVFKNKGLNTIPDQYIVSRWLKSCLVKPIHDMVCEEVQMITIIDEKQKLHNHIMSDFYGWMHKIHENYEWMSSFRHGMNDLGRRITGLETQDEIDNRTKLFQDFYGGERPDQIDVHPPNVVKTKDSGSRLKSKKEAAIKAFNKKPRLCSKCKQYANHDARNCGKKSK